jgi:hypothetical protein
MSDAEVPYMFRGEKRIYRVIGLQGGTFYGLNVDTYGYHDSCHLVLAFACLGDPAPGSPFKSRQAGKFLVAFEKEPTGPVAIEAGHRLDKLDIKVGRKLSSFEMSAYLEKQLPALKAWLDATLEKAGIMANFNDSAEVFAHFFGEVKNDAEYFPLELPDLGTYKGDDAPAMDFSQYGKGSTNEAFSKGVDPATGEIKPEANPHQKPNHWDAPGAVGVPPEEGSTTDEDDET